MILTFTEMMAAAKQAGLATTQADLSVLMGKRPSYVSSRKSRGRTASLDALTRLNSHLLNLQDEIHDRACRGVPPTSGGPAVSARMVWQFQDWVAQAIAQRCRQGGEGQA